MADRTQLNRDLNRSNATVLNQDIAPNQGQSGGGATVLNPKISASDTIGAGSLLCGKYRVVEKMPVVAGEADLYVCRQGSQKYVAKVYRRTASIKAEVIERLRRIKSPYIAAIYEVGAYRGATVEILPYYSRGSLSGRTFHYEQLRSKIIPCLNEGLKALHDAKIIHKDLKPSNIMLTDDQQSVAIIDFGISSAAEATETVLVTQTGMTPEYSAPETFKGLYSSHADYYALGITLYELFCGKTPYGNMPAEEIEKYIAIQRIPFPKTMPAELQELIKALTYYDISNRRDKNNPNRRWGYDEVKKWLAGVKQTIPGEGVDRRAARPYFFAGKTILRVPISFVPLQKTGKKAKKSFSEENCLIITRSMILKHTRSVRTQNERRHVQAARMTSSSGRRCTRCSRKQRTFSGREAYILDSQRWEERCWNSSGRTVLLWMAIWMVS